MVYIQIRQLYIFNILKFRNISARADYSSALSTTDANGACDNLILIYKSPYEMSCPIKTIRVNKKYKREPWVTSGIFI